MRLIKWAFWLSVWAVVAAFLHYTLPQKDIVRLTETEIRRVDVGDRPLFWASADTGTQTLDNRDVRFIVGFDGAGQPHVYRNEDTGWGWPPYFKLDSSNLQAQAGDLVSTSADPRWVSVRHYGWRSELLSIFPNAISVTPVAGPAASTISWTTVVILILLALLAWFAISRWVRFKEARITPVMDDMDAAWDERRARWRRRREEKRAERLARGE